MSVFSWEMGWESGELLLLEGTQALSVGHERRLAVSSLGLYSVKAEFFNKGAPLLLFLLRERCLETPSSYPSLPWPLQWVFV